MIEIRFPDKTIKKFPKGITPFEIAKTISEGLARNILVARINNNIVDTNKVIQSNKIVDLELITWDQVEGKNAMWHSSAHLMAEAIESFYPHAKLTIGPAIENGFYYDIDFPKNINFSSEDFPIIENKMMELAKKKNKYIISKVSKKDALKHYTIRKNKFKIELINELNDERLL